MILTLAFDAPPFSVNKSHYRNGNRTLACRKWGDSILDQLKKYEDEIIVFRNKFNELEHCFETKLVFLYPSDKLYTLSGKISRRSNDCSNIEKMFVDLMFDKRFDARGFTNLNSDDTLVIEQNSYKRLSPTNCYHIILEVKIEGIDKSKDLSMLSDIPSLKKY